LPALPGCALLPHWLSRGVDRGLASWYGNEYHGRTTASGEVFNQWAMTAAHRDYPFGSVVRVTNLENGREVVVRINDRGPWVRGRIIDVSRGAAAKLGMIRAGVVPCRVDVLDWGG
jgi:rare lipoprotein A